MANGRDPILARCRAWTGWLLTGALLVTGPGVPALAAGHPVQATGSSAASGGAPAGASERGDDVPRISLGQAIQVALDRNPSIRIQATQVTISQGQAQQADGKFDYNLTALLQGTDGQADRLESVSYNAGFSKMLPVGISVGPTVEATQQLSGTTAYSKSIVALSLTIPLLQGLGVDVVTATQRAAQANLASNQSQLRFVTATQLLEVIQAYWGVRAAEEQLAIDRQVESRYRELVTMTEDLVRGAIQPAAQITQAKASLEQSVASRIAGEQNLTSAIQNLAVLLGVHAADASSAPQALDRLPPPSPVPHLDRAVLDRLVRLALDRRDDLRAADQQVETNEYLLVAAQNQVLPQLNLQLGGGLGGITEGARTFRQIMPLDQDSVGLAAQGSLSFSFPLENNLAKGQLLTQQGAVDQTRANRAQVASQIGTAVIDAALGLQRAYHELEKLDQSYALFEQSLKNQRELFKLGMASIVDVTTTEQSLAQAQGEQLSGQLNFANAVAQLRWTTGTLLPPPGTRDPAGRIEQAALVARADPAEEGGGSDASGH